MPERFPENFPRELYNGRGARVWDFDGREYVDWICALGAVTLGYGRDEVDTAVALQVKKGPLFSLPTRLEWEVAEQFCDFIPCAEMVRFTKTGSEATEGAIRIARAYTGRDTILTCGYHSWHSWYAATKREHPGVPKDMRALAHAFQYNDIESFKDWLNPSVAAVIMEPIMFEQPADHFLERVAELTRKAGAMLIWDETLTGFRWPEGSYHKRTGILPDLAIFGKAMGNGYPIAAVCGRRELMQEWGKLVSGTFGGDCIGLAATQAVMDIWEQEDVAGRIEKRGRELLDRYPNYLEGTHYRMRWITANWGMFSGKLCLLSWSLSPTTLHGADEELAVFIQETCRRGVLFHPGGFNVSAALTDRDMTRTFTAIDESLDALRRGVKLLGKAPTLHPFRG